MIHTSNPAQCCGCTACAAICPKDAIKMRPDPMGFYYPIVDTNRCINCNLCNKVCAFNKDYDKSLNLIKPEVYAVRHKLLEEIETSRSGAAFIAISDWIIAQRGIIYGAGYSNDFSVVHKRATTKEERNEFKGSKYVQSYMGSIFRSIKQDLIDGRIVLFSGTPCQTAGLNAFVGKKLRDRLYLIDIVCHGVPAPYIWRDYLKYIETRVDSKITSVNFRDKTYHGWNAHKESISFEDKTTIYNETYTHLFYKHIMLRESCGECHYTNILRPSDITIADFWGWEKTSPTFNQDNKGVSLVIVNTEKGQHLFQNIKSDINFIATDIDRCQQPCLQHPTTLHKQRNKFRQDYINHGFTYIGKKYGNLGWRYKFIVLKRKANTAITLLKRFVK